MAFNWKLALRKASVQAMLALFIQLASMQQWPTVEQLWIPLVVAGLAFFTVLEKEENTGGTVNSLKLKKKKDNPGNTVLKLKKVKRFIAESLVG